MGHDRLEVLDLTLPRQLLQGLQRVAVIRREFPKDAVWIRLEEVSDGAVVVGAARSWHQSGTCRLVVPTSIGAAPP
ncbi:MAG: hypothetical protein VCB43_09895 [Myxococcota bacterium]